jgi:hypothetical protein
MSSVKTPFSTIEEAIEDIRQGKMVVVCDDESRENEGDQLHAQGGRRVDLPGADPRAL